MFQLNRHFRRSNPLSMALAISLALGAAPAGAEQYKVQTFNKPMVSGNFLDLCYSGSNCAEGKAQTAYCQSRGFDKAVNWSTAVVPFLQATRKIGDGSLCNTGCTMVTSVNCATEIASPNPGGAGPSNGKIDPGAAIAIGIGAAIVGGIIGNAAKKKKAKNEVQPVDQPAPQPAAGGLSAQHVDWCYAKYKSYKAATNTYTSLNGQRKFCNSPYM